MNTNPHKTKSPVVYGSTFSDLASAPIGRQFAQRNDGVWFARDSVRTQFGAGWSKWRTTDAVWVGDTSSMIVCNGISCRLPKKQDTDKVRV